MRKGGDKGEHFVEFRLLRSSDRDDDRLLCSFHLIPRQDRSEPIEILREWMRREPKRVDCRLLAKESDLNEDQKFGVNQYKLVSEEARRRRT